jgi:glycosyltransferase involved in cell wall biosynthesis
VSPVVVNGRFLRATPTGLHRVARALLVAGAEAGLEVEVAAPPGVDDALALRWPMPTAPASTARDAVRSVRSIGRRRGKSSGQAPSAGLQRRLGDQAWEQFVLPRLAGDRRILSLTNTSPLASRHSTVLVHDLAPMVGPQWFTPAMRSYGRVVLAGARHAEQVLTVSAQVATELQDRGVAGDIRVIRQAVDDINAAGPETVATARDRHRLTSYLLMVGWADPRKDVVTALAAHQRALRARRHELVLVGLAHPVFAAVSAPRLPTVRALGYVEDTELAALMTGAAALVYPSRYEGFGRPALEAWRCGTPALVSDLPAIRESTSGRAVYLPPGDVDAWAEAMVAALEGVIATPTPDPWTWQDAGRQLLAAMG